MFQQIVVDPIRSRCKGFSLHDWSPQISQSEGLVVDFGVVWGEVNFGLFLLLLYGLECSTVVGRGGVVCEYCSMFFSNIFGSVMVVPFFPFRYCLGGQMFLPDIFLTLSHTCFIGVSADSFDTYSAHDWRFSWLKSHPAFACDLLKADMVSPLNSRLCRTLLSRARLAFRASQHSSSNQGFNFLGMVVALGMQSFAALVMCSTKSLRDLLPLVYPQRCFPNTHHETVPNWPWKKPSGKDHSLVVSLPLMVGWKLSDKGTCISFCWVPSHCDIEGNERVDQLAEEPLEQNLDPQVSVDYTDMKPLVNSYIQRLVQTKWDVAVHGRDFYLVKPRLGPPKKFQHLTRAEEVVITRLRIGHTKATKSNILSWGPPTGCHHCGQTLTTDHMLLECALLQECRDENYTVDSLNALFQTISEACIVEFLRETGIFYLIWYNLLASTSPKTFTIWSDLSNLLEIESNSEIRLLV